MMIMKTKKVVFIYCKNLKINKIQETGRKKTNNLTKNQKTKQKILDFNQVHFLIYSELKFYLVFTSKSKILNVM